MKLISNRLRGPLLFLILSGLSLGLLIHLANYTFVRVVITNSHASYFKIYWQTAEQPQWSEEQSSTIHTNSFKKHYLVSLAVPLSKITLLRIDPTSQNGVSTRFYSLALTSLTTHSLHFSRIQLSKALKPNSQLKPAGSSGELTFVATGNDPGFLLEYPEVQKYPEPLLLYAQALLLAAILTIIIITLAPHLLFRLRWVPVAMIFVLALIVSMAVTSNRNTHPDEHTHLINAGFYVNHYIPPKACSPETLKTYTGFGVSRLDNREIAYFLGGRYLQLVDFIPAPGYIKLRFLNVFFFLILTLLACRRVQARILFLPLLLTPQAWYLFSYYNSDALSLFVVVLLSYQIFVSESILRQLVKNQLPPTRTVIGICIMGLLVAMQFWLKLNYIFYPFFICILGVFWVLQNRRLPDFKSCRPILIAGLIGIVVFSSWEISRHAVNNFELAKNVESCRETTAWKMYKPSTPMEQTAPGFRLKAKGIPAKKIITHYEWPRRIFYTGLGAYGYTQYLNSDIQYQVASFFMVMLLLFTLGSVLKNGGRFKYFAIIAMISAMTGITVAAFLNSWVNVFQAQGRYLLVYLPLLGSLMAMYSRRINVTILSLLASIPFAFALYSFLAVAMVEIPS